MRKEKHATFTRELRKCNEEFAKSGFYWQTANLSRHMECRARFVVILREKVMPLCEQRHNKSEYQPIADDACEVTGCSSEGNMLKIPSEADSFKSHYHNTCG